MATGAFKLSFDIPSSVDKINYTDSILLIGSCFSDEMGMKLSKSKLNVLSNPFGTIYHPLAIFKLLADEISESDIIENQEVYYHWDTHSEVSATSKKELIDLMHRKREQTQSYLRRAKWLIITPGTSIVYERAGHIVANCHKVPVTQFHKHFLSQDEIRKSFETFHEKLQSTNPDIKIVFTISPVRHIRDGLIENNRSKAILIDAIQSIVQDYQHISYFPSYEILIDELRDYRFYSDDMIHPSKQATDYIWERFCECYFDEETLSFLNEWKAIESSLNHRPQHPETKKHQDFLRNTLQRLERMNDKVDVSVEIDHIKSQIR